MERSFEQVGTGLTVFTDEAPVEGPVRWLDSPQAVLEFVQSGDVANTIVVARGGTTTFLTPALTAGVKGVLTLQGAPESHLGILAREYGIPCVMGVTFTHGVRSARGEIIPADGAVVRLDISSGPDGCILIETGAPRLDDWDGPTPPVMDAETLAQIQLLLERHGGEIPHGSEGDAQIRSTLTTEVLSLTDESLRGGLTVAEVNDLSRYAGWNIWDCLAARATEGESGLIPRQEYESVAFVQCWQRYPEFVRMITEEVGVDGLIEIGATARREIGTKANLLHAWAVALAPAFGRAVSMGLGLADPGERGGDLAETFQFQRRLYRGMWGVDGAQMFTASHGYAAPLLGSEWLERFRDERTVFEDAEHRRAFQHFNASTEMMSFLLAFDCRVGLSDTGPYPTEDGGFVIVRDHFLSEGVYQWGLLAPDLPYAITQAMYFKPDEPLEVQLLDISTIFTQPANYLKHLKGATVYVRDRCDTPVDQVRLIDETEMARLQAACDRGTSALYPHIAAMSRREKIMAGVKVYYTDFILPFARRAGVWERMVGEHDFFEIDPVASEAYYRLVKDGAAAQLVPHLFLTGTCFPPLPAMRAVIDDPNVLAAICSLGLRGNKTDLGAEAGGAEELGLATRTKAGWMLTAEGHTFYEEFAAAERKTIDPAALRSAYDRFLRANEQFKEVALGWHTADKEGRYEILARFEQLVERIQPTLRRTAEVLPRCSAYGPRLAEALERAFAGDHDYAIGPAVDSVHTVWMELHADLLQLQGITREQEGSY